jgi:hypothetical protein
LSPILGIIASQNYPRITNSYESIATVTVGSGGASSVSFTSIPSTYQHLQVRAIGRLTVAGTSTGNISTKYNNDSTAANYTSHRILGENGSVYAQSQVGYSPDIGIAYDAQWPNTSATASVFGVMVLDILDYANTSKYKTTRSLNGADGNNTSVSDVGLASGLYLSTSAINRIDFAPFTNGFAQYTQFALYGIKGN